MRAYAIARSDSALAGRLPQNFSKQKSKAASEGVSKIQRQHRNLWRQEILKGFAGLTDLQKTAKRFKSYQALRALRDFAKIFYEALSLFGSTVPPRSNVLSAFAVIKQKVRFKKLLEGAGKFESFVPLWFYRNHLRSNARAFAVWQNRKNVWD